MTIEDLKQGNESFRQTKFNDYKNDFETLVENGQTPNVLFIGCSDSRVVPDLILDSKPGDMFIVRNVGNFVPPFKADQDFHGNAAAIEYAVSVLEVEHIIICGHSHCGACKALYMDLEDDISLIHTKKWLQLGEKAKNYVLTSYPNVTEEQKYRLTEKNSIVFQLQNLLSYPKVSERIKNKKLNIHGWYYKIENGSIEYYNFETKEFE